MSEKRIVITVSSQTLTCFEDQKIVRNYTVSTAKNGVGEAAQSECTPRGKHCVQDIIGRYYAPNSVFVARKWTGEIYSDRLAQAHPDRDWILTRIVRLAGLEPGRNQGGNVDTFQRFIYIHGTPHTTELGVPGSHGCIRMCNDDIINLADWALVGTSVFIEE